MCSSSNTPKYFIEWIGVSLLPSDALIVLLSLNDVIISNHWLFIYRVIWWDTREEEEGGERKFFFWFLELGREAAWKNKKNLYFLTPCFGFLSLQLRTNIWQRGYKAEFDSAPTPHGISKFTIQSGSVSTCYLESF